MTSHKHLKQLVRARMTKTGESYATARRHIVRQSAQPSADPATQWHFPGNVSATTALRIVLAHAGVRAPHERAPFSEALLFGIAGGIGIGIFTFFYEKEGFASFYIAGRHLWQDDEQYFRDACVRLGIEPKVKETGGAKQADRHLAETLEQGPCIAWVDAAQLPHRAMPETWSGGAYHVITVYAIHGDDVVIGDRSDQPITIPLAALRAARRRITKFKHRLLTVPETRTTPELAPLVRDGLRACHDGLVEQRSSNFTLEAIRIWGERLHGSKDRESWDRIFAPGKRLWRGLVSIYDFIEHYGTGGGLCRPLFADFLAEAADATGDARLRPLAATYTELGHEWTALAHAALPDHVPALRRARELHDRKAELVAAGGPADEAREVWNEITRLEQEADAQFPLSTPDSAALRAALQQRVLALYEGEKAACAELGMEEHR
jgi:hypothetical protein